MRFTTYIFDLDGTLLDTLPDLVRLTNMVLEESGWPTRTRDEILGYVGNGGRALLERAAPQGADADAIDRAFSHWRALYPEYGHALTKPYEGIRAMLGELERRGAHLGVLSNKFDAAVRQVVADHFPGVFDLAWGEREDVPRKPDPRGLLAVISRFGSSPESVAFIGDSPTDIETARAAGVAGIAVTWGYRSRESLKAAHPDYIISSPAELPRL